MGKKEDFFTDGQPDFDKLFGSYEALERKLGEQPKPQTKKLERTDLIPFFQEATQNEGKLSDASYKNLEDTYGLTKDVIDEFAQGQQAKAELFHRSIVDSVGGQEQYDSMISWAKENLSDDEKRVLVRQVDQSGDAAEAVTALRGIQARMGQANPGNPAHQQIEGRPPVSGQIQAFRSADELAQAVGDPKYGSDEVYTREVTARVEATPANIVDAKSLTPQQ